MSEVPQVPWDTIEASIHVLETFNLAVHGKLFIDPFESQTANETPLIENYQFKNNLCTVTLRRNIYFHNDREVTAYDVEFSLYRYLLQNDNNFSLSLLDDICGIENRDRNNIQHISANFIHYPSNYISGITIIDNYTLVFQLKQNAHHFLQRISDARLPIVPIEELENNYIQWKKYPIGFGKYHVTFADYTNYEFYLEKVSAKENIPHYVKLTFQVDKNADIKMLFSTPNKATEKNIKTIYFKDFYANAGFLYNYQSELGQNENFRTAISLALDRHKICHSGILNEISAEDQLLPNYGLFKKYRSKTPILKRDIEKAKDLLRLVPEHLWKNRVFQVPTITDIKEINQLPYMNEIKSQLNEVGIQIEFLPTNTKYDKFKKNDRNILWFTGFAFANKDPLKNFSYFKSGSYFSYEYPSDPEFGLLYNNSIKDNSSSPLHIQKLSAYFTQKNIMTVIFNQRMCVSYNPKKVASIGKQTNGIEFCISDVKLSI